MTRRVLATASVCIVIALGAIALSGCKAAGYTAGLVVPAGEPQRAEAKGQPVDDLAGAMNDFGVELLRATPGEGNGNVVVSPASVHAALSMTVNGATGETAEQMRAVLHTDAMTPEQANLAWASLLSGLGNRGPEETLEVANALWAREGVVFKQPFMNADRDYFGAQLSTLDFEKDDVAGAINAWASKQTHGMITRVVEDVPSTAILYLGNAVYFKGEWAVPFENRGTRDVPFMRPDGSKLDVPMMHATATMPYAYNGSVQATRLMYKGSGTAYYVFLPKKGLSLDSALKSLDGGGFAKLRSDMQSMVSTEVVLGLPKMDTEFGTSLKPALSKLGMPRAFDIQAAQFEAMADSAQFGGPVFIGDVLHKTKVKVDELGTEAAAVTVVEMTAGAAAPMTLPPMMICDRPYLFAIVDEHSGAMLFLGAVNDPSK